VATDHHNEALEEPHAATESGVFDDVSLSGGERGDHESSPVSTEAPSSSSAMNVLQISKYYFPIAGGMQTVVRSLVTGIDGADFRILTSRPWDGSDDDEADGTKIVRPRSIGEFKSTPISPSFPYHLRQQLPWADLVHYHLPFPIGPLSHLLNRTGDTPTVVTFHDDIIEKGPIVYPYKPVLDRFLDAAERIIVTSPNMRDNTAQISKFAGKTSVVPLGVETAGLEIEPHEVSNRHLVFVGRLVSFKGVEYLISAMKGLDASLSIVGRGPCRDDLERHAEDVGVSQKVTFEGFVSDEKLDRLYRAADAFVLPSVGENESFGIVQLEAMKRGLPVINTALPTGVPYVSVDGVTGITVPPKRPAAIADAVSTLFENPDLYRRYSTNAQRRVRREFSREQLLRKTEDIYRDVLSME